MRFYVAAKYCDRDAVRIVYGDLIDRGHSITCDWTNHDIYPEDAPLEKKAEFAIDDIEGVRNADAVIAIFIEERHQRGALIEIGAALALGKPVMIVGEHEASSTLLQHPLITRFKTIGDVYESIDALAVMNT